MKQAAKFTICSTFFLVPFSPAVVECVIKV